MSAERILVWQSSLFSFNKEIRLSVVWMGTALWISAVCCRCQVFFFFKLQHTEGFFQSVCVWSAVLKVLPIISFVNNPPVVSTAQSQEE